MIKKIAIAALTGGALFAASGAQAHPYSNGYYGGGYYNSYPYRYAPRVVYRPVYRPYSYYYPAPRYYYEPSPTIYGRIPIGHHGSIGFRLPL